MRMSERHQLTELQLAILRVVWDQGEATVQDIWEALHKDRGLAQTTVATMLSRLQLATPQAVRLPGAQSSLTLGANPGPLNSGPATPVTPVDQGSQTPGVSPGSVSSRRSSAPSLPMVIVLLWGVIALASSLY